MNLFRKHNKKPFERQLEEQLGDLEYKPSESLWERIDSGMDADGFEPAMHAKLDSFEQIPHPETWNKIERRLPAPPSSIRRFSFLGVLLFTLTLSVATGYFLLSKTNQEAVVTPQKVNNPHQQEEQQMEVVSRPSSKEPTSTNTHRAIHSGPQQGSSNPTQPSIPKATRSAVAAPSAGVLPQPFVVGSTAKPQPSSNNNAQQRPTPTKAAEATVILANRNEVVPPLPAAPANGMEKTDAMDSQSVASASIPSTADSIVFAKGREIVNGSMIQADSSMVVASNQQPAFEDELTRFSISVFGGASLSGTTYSSPSSSNLNFDENIKLRKEIERPTVDWSGGFMLDYRINDHWMISSGMMMVNFNQQFQYDLDSAVSPANPADVGAPVVNPGDSFLVGNTYSNRIRYTWTEIPLLVNYTLHRGRSWDIDLQGGVGYAFINTIDGGMVSYDNKGVLVLKDKESFPQISNTVFMTLQPQISKKFGQGVSIGIVPSFKYSITSIIGNETWIQQHPYFIGLSACLRKRF